MFVSNNHKKLEVAPTFIDAHPAPPEDEGFTLEDLMAELGRLELQALGYVKHGDVPRENP